MDKKSYLGVAGGLFLLIGLLHLWRIIQGWEAEVSGFAIPFWWSWVVVLVGLYMAYQGLKHRRG